MVRMTKHEVERDRPLVMWELTRACRAGCRRCPGGVQQRRSSLELSTYEAYKVIDQIAAIQPREVIITGGDPFERDDLFQLIDYARRRGLDPALAVSGTQQLTNPAVEKLAAAGLTRLVVGVDAHDPTDHEHVRGASSTFGPTLMGVRAAHLSKIVVEVSTLATPRLLRRFTAFTELLEDMSVERWNLFFLVPVAGSMDVEMLTADEVEDLFGRLFALESKAPYGIRTFEAPHYARFVAQRGGGDLRTVAADHLLFLSQHGDVTTSPFSRERVGSIRFQTLRTIAGAERLTALRNPTHLKGKCGRCEFKDICGGSRARAFAMTGDVFAADPLCAYQPSSPAALVAQN